MSNKSMELVISDFVARQRQLLELELQSEQEEEQKASTSTVNNKTRSGKDAAVAASSTTTAVVLRDLQVSEVSVGLYGRTVVTLTTINTKRASDEASILPLQASSLSSSSSQPLLPAHRFTVGDEVEIRSSSSSSPKDSSSGVISSVTDTSLSIALFSKRKQQQHSSNISKKESTSKQDEEEDNDEENMLGPPPLMIVPKSAMEVHRKLIQALDQLQQHGIYHPIAGNVVEACFTNAATSSFDSSSSSSLSSRPPQPPTHFINTTLDDSQQEAIRFCLQSSDRPVTLCHGPPGTGKTTTMAELIRQAVQVHHMKVLVTAPSNVAVDNILERLVQTMSSTSSSSSHSKRKTSSSSSISASKSIRLVRLGHPARIKPSILPFSLESLVYHAEGTEIVADVRKELQSFLQILTSNKKKTRGVDRKVAYQEVKRLRKEVQVRENKVIQELLSKAQVILATTVGAANSILRRYIPDGFDVVIIDEAAQALEASCWIPALQGKRLILAGDHCQLPPTIQNVKVQAELGKTLFERIMKLYKDDKEDSRCGVGRVSRMLQVQYRMNESIANWASTAMYGGKLKTHASVQKRTLSDLMAKKAPSQLLHPLTTQPADNGEDMNNDDDDEGDMSKTTLLWIDTAGCGMHESTNAAGSRYNEGEAQVVAQHVHTLLRMGIKPTDIAIITPYNGQVELLRSILLSTPLPSDASGGQASTPHLEIRSVDGFQGGEREAVVISLVRSSERSGGAGSNAGIGFLRDNRRLNVAVTRAKRHCAVIGDSETVCQSKLIHSLCRWIEVYGEQRSAMEYLQSQENYEVAVQADLRDAQKMLCKVSAETSKNTNNSNKTPTKPKQPSDKLAEDERRKAVLGKISTFADKGNIGDEMILSTELSRYDRKVVHEFATELGLGHASQGTEGVDRRIILSISSAAQTSEQPPAAIIDDDDPGDNLSTVESPSDNQFEASKVSAFTSSFENDERDDEQESENEPDDDEKGESKVLESSVSSVMNNILGNLARERAEREYRKSLVNTNKSTLEPTKKAPKPKGQKLGGSKRISRQVVLSRDEVVEDDMTFLNAQIEHVQTSHGRRVDGTGSNFRTVVNGILIAKPPKRINKHQRHCSQS